MRGCAAEDMLAWPLLLWRFYLSLDLTLLFIIIKIIESACLSGVKSKDFKENKAKLLKILIFIKNVVLNGLFLRN